MNYALGYYLSWLIMEISGDTIWIFCYEERTLQLYLSCYP